MAITNTEVQITWSAANSVSVAASGNQTSDAFTYDATTIDAMIELKADNAGTPATAFTVDFYWLMTLGDPDGAATEEYATVGHPIYLATIDTNVEDPAIAVVPLPVTGLYGKLYAVNNDATNAQTVSATIYEKRSA